MRCSRIFGDDHHHTFRHHTTLHASYVNAKKRSQPSIMPESTTRPDKDTRESTCCVETPCCWHPYAQTDILTPPSSKRLKRVSLKLLTPSSIRYKYTSMPCRTAASARRTTVSIVASLGAVDNRRPSFREGIGIPYQFNRRFIEESTGSSE